MIEGITKIDEERKQKVFAVAKVLKKNIYKLRAVWFEDVERWGLVCTARINGKIYDAANYLDDFEPKDHADIFRAAFSQALMEAEKETKQLLTIH